MYLDTHVQALPDIAIIDAVDFNPSVTVLIVFPEFQNGNS